jgi:hypothetical protein
VFHKGSLKFILGLRGSRNHFATLWCAMFSFTLCQLSDLLAVGKIGMVNFYQSGVISNLLNGMFTHLFIS